MISVANAVLLGGFSTPDAAFSINIQTSNFTQNSASYNGGVLSAFGDGVLQLHNCNFMYVALMVHFYVML